MSTRSHSSSFKGTRDAGQREGACPTGRVEMLAWINGVCGASYPSVESLRDGIAYLTLIEAAVTRTASGASSSSTTSAQSILAKADVEVSGFMFNVGSSQGNGATDPARDSMHVKERCERNFHLLQEMLRRCVPRELSMELDVKRLAIGKLQDHMRLLQWCFGFVTKIFKQSQKQHTQQQQQVDAKLVRSQSANPAAAAAGRREQQESSRTSSAVSGDAERGRSRDGRSARPKTSGSPASSKQPRAMSMVNSATTNSNRHYDSQMYAPEPNVDDDVDAELLTLLRDVELLEEALWHRTSAGGTGAEVLGADGRQSTRASTAVVTLVSDFGSAAPSNTLETVKGLLSERDVLWQTLVAVEAAVMRANDRRQRAQLRGGSPPSPVVVSSATDSTLLEELCATFSIRLTS